MTDIHLYKEYQFYHKNQNSNFYRHLIFKIMKKQILFLAFFILAILASTTNSFGQVAVHWSIPQPFTCVADPLHPIPGVKYTYSASVVDPSAPAGDGEWRFWATTDPNFITDNSGTPVFNYGSALTVGPNELITASTDYNIAIGDPAVNKDGTIDITWSQTILDATKYQVTPTFVVAYYVNNAGCTDNIKVWELDPKNGFIVDIIPMDPANFVASRDAYGANPNTCVDLVESVTYTAGSLDYDFGDNYLYFEFVAANFTGSWTPRFDLQGLNAAQAWTSTEYTLATPDTWGGTPPTWTPLVSGTTSIAADPTITDMTLGVSVFVRVKVDHNEFENILGETLTMVLDGQLPNGNWDVDNTDCTQPDPTAFDELDKATTTLTPRPDIQRPTSTTSPAVPNIQMIDGNQAS
jgi:hypothetical protein